jgi:opacity protein-like surface antigen
MKNLLIALLLFPLVNMSLGQERRDRIKPLTEGVYLDIGMANGPGFSEFFGFVNDFYGERYLNTSDRIDDFGNGATLGMGYMLRLYPNFALDVGFSIYRLESKGEIINNNPAYPQEIGVRHEVEYQVGIFSATLPVLLDFSPRQPIVPYVGIGVSIFAMRLDDVRDDGYIVSGSRDTGTTVGGHFEAGAFLKLSRKIWIDVKGRWHNGSGHLRAQEPGGFFDKYRIEHDFNLASAGVIYYFR